MCEIVFTSLAEFSRDTRRLGRALRSSLGHVVRTQATSTRSVPHHQTGWQVSGYQGNGCPLKNTHVIYQRSSFCTEGRESESHFALHLVANRYPVAHFDADSPASQKSFSLQPPSDLTTDTSRCFGGTWPSGADVGRARAQLGTRLGGRSLAPRLQLVRGVAAGGRKTHGRHRWVATERESLLPALLLQLWSGRKLSTFHVALRGGRRAGPAAPASPRRARRPRLPPSEGSSGVTKQSHAQFI